MAWLFACFGYSKKRKRLKPSRTIHSQHKGIGTYQPLRSSLPQLPEGSEGGSPKPIHSNLKRRKHSCKDQGKPRIRKKVRFDLNVIAYEPVPAYEDDDNDDDLRSILETNWGEEHDQEVEEEEESVDFLLCTGNSVGMKRERSGNSIYRYSNCYDEEEEMGSEVDDLDDEDEDDDDDEDEDHGSTSFINAGCLYLEEVSDQIDKNSTCTEHETAHESLESDPSRSRCVNPVLIPIENLNQWRAIKMKRWEIVA